VVCVLALVLLCFVPRPAFAGYTHYWRWHARPDATSLGACIADMARIAEARRELLEDRDGRTGAQAVFPGRSPFGDAGELSPDIVFNGIGEDGHETFGFPLAPFTGNAPEFQFVKTAEKPYDEVVAACLIVARDYFPPEVLGIASDGRWGREWTAGAALYKHVLGREPKNPIHRWEPDTGEERSLPQTEPADDPGSLRKNLLVSAIVFVALILAYLLLRRGRE
jgi:hypothetical protein